MSKLIIICGLPGSGKTTLARQLEKKLSAVRFCPDEWMSRLLINLHDEKQRAVIEALQWEMAQSILIAGGTAIIEWGTWGKSERDALRLKARELNASVELHYLHAPVEVLYERITSRRMEDPPIERDALTQWLEAFQVPSTEEMKLYDKPTSP